MIIGNYKIESDALNVTLFKRTIVKEKKGGKGKKPKLENIGTERWVILGYYATLPGALQGLVNYGLNESGMKTVELLLAKMNELLAAINSITGSDIASLNKTLSVSSKPRNDTDNIVDPPEINNKPIVRRGRGRPKKY